MSTSFIIKWFWLWFSKKMPLVVNFKIPISEDTDIPINSNGNEKIV